MRRIMFKNYIFSLPAAVLLCVIWASTASGHCQVPCGIYNDHARVDMMLEDSATVLKAVKMIASLAGKTDEQSYNQRVRWIMNKEKHAQNVIATISNYFLTQRVKPDQKDYLNRLAAHHAVIIAAMKAKQSADEYQALSLEKALRELAVYYPPVK